MENVFFLEANTTGSPNSVGVRCSFFVEKMEFRTYFVYFYTFSYKFKVQRTHTELGLPVQTHAPTGALFSLRAKEAALCGRFRTLGTNTHSKMAGEGHGCFFSFFIYFARLVVIIDRSNRNNCIIYLFKQF